MPSALTIGAFALASFALIVVPGPNLVYIVTQSVTHGTRAGMASAAGVETATLVYVLASVVGVSAMISESEIAFASILYAGAAYLVYLAVQTLRHPPGVQMDAMAMPARSLGRTYLDAAVVNLLNPKVALFFVAFLPQFLAPSDEAGAIPVQLMIFGAVFFVIALALDIGYAQLGGTARRWLREGGGQFTWVRWPVFVIYLGLATYAVLGGPRVVHQRYRADAFATAGSRWDWRNSMTERGRLLRSQLQRVDAGRVQRDVTPEVHTDADLQ